MRIKKEYLIVLSLLAIYLFTSLYHLEQKVSFGWDQERDANVIWQIIKEGKLTLIGPRAVSEDSFFLGPFWYYLLLPFYLLFNLDPIGIGVFGVILQSATLLTFYLVGKQLFGEKVGLISAYLYLPMGAIVVWNPILIPLFSLILLYLFISVSKGKKEFIPITFFLTGLSLQIHFQSIFFVIPLIISLIFNNKVSKSSREIFIGIGLFLLTFLPILLFDIRHNFLNFFGLVKLFFFQSKNSVNFLPHFLDGILKFINSISSPFLINTTPLYKGLFILTILLIGFTKSNLSKEIKIILLSFLLTPPILFSLYGGTISEYYFTITLIPIIFGLSSFLNNLPKTKIGYFILFTFIFLTFFQKSENFKVSEVSTNLYFQKQVVLYIINQNLDPKFNVSFDTPANADAGFRYLFKYFKKEPENIPQAHLWTIVIPPTNTGKNPNAVFGDIGVVRR